MLKPGGHVLAFGGPRTFHRMAVAVEDAGFEIRDSIAWMYGSGFPKSLDVSKAIDKGQGKNRERQVEFVAWMRKTGLKAGQINAAIGMSDVGSHYLRHDQPAIATADLFDLLRPLLPPVPENIERLVAERTGIEWTEYKKRVVTGVKTGTLLAVAPGENRERPALEMDVTEGHTSEAKQWEGWGTALKPAFEPIVVGRKPFAKGSTVAANVLLHGVGGLNIDASRVESAEDTSRKPSLVRDTPAGFGKGTSLGGNGSALGRWPANVILDEYSAGLLDEQSGENPSRFFYCAKASKRDRNEGLDGLADGVTGSFEGNVAELSGRKIGANPDKPNLPGKNFHPTVKPTTLMRYLIKLVTPPGGTVLDPFTGSGSTGKAALLDGYKFVGAELTEEYLPIIEGRLRWAYEQGTPADDETLF